MIRSRSILVHLASVLLLPILAPVTAAQCPEEAPLGNYTGSTTIGCPCFITGEEVGVILDAPAADYPIEITHIRVAWGSILGGTPQSLEAALKIYPAGLPNPGAPQFSVAGPLLSDGFLNDFDITLFPGNRVVTSGPFLVSLEFQNPNAGNVLAPSVVHDGNGCQSGKNAVKAIPGGWNDACFLGVTGDWVIDVIYKKAAAATVENGSGVNPLTFTSVTPPAIGQTWTTTLDCSAHAPSVATVIGHSQLFPTPVTFAFGELIVDPASIFVFRRTRSHGGGTATFNSPLPPDPSFCGLTVFAQGACFGAPATQASNALRVRVGD